MLIETKKHYQRSRKMLLASQKGLITDQKKLTKEGRSKAEIKRLLDPTRAFLADMEFDIKQYERAKSTK